MKALGINWGFHDSAVALVSSDAGVLHAAEEERFSGCKAETCFPSEALLDCLKSSRVGAADLDAVAVGWHPGLLLLQRCVASHLFRYPAPWSTIQHDLKRAWALANVRKQLVTVDPHFARVKIRFVRHHVAHAASAIGVSGFGRGAYLVIDGRGESDAVSWGRFSNGRAVEHRSRAYPHSIGRVYSAVCRFLGFDKPERAGTVMALAAHGRPRFSREFDSLLALQTTLPIPSLVLGQRYFDLTREARASREMEQLFGVPPRMPGSELEQIHMDIAASLQAHTEKVVLAFMNALSRSTGETHLCFAGGVALNAVINGRARKETGFRHIFVQPAANDAGVALGAAVHELGEMLPNLRLPPMTSALLGPSFSDEEAVAALASAGAEYHKIDNAAACAAGFVADGKVVCVFQGRMEFGPRALGSRSMLADPTALGVKDRLNGLKRREWFRPFGVAVLESRAAEIFQNLRKSPFMLEVDRLAPAWADRLAPVVHVDGTVRVQTVSLDSSPFLTEVLGNLESRTGIPLVLNTSLNTKGKPICCSPKQAIEAWLESGADALVIGRYCATKTARTNPNGAARQPAQDIR